MLFVNLPKYGATTLNNWASPHGTLHIQCAAYTPFTKRSSTSLVPSFHLVMFATAVVMSASRRERRHRSQLRAVNETRARRSKLSQGAMFWNSLLLTLAELPGPWEQWRQRRRAAVIREVDLIEVLRAAMEAPLHSIAEERREASSGILTETSSRFDKHIQRKMEVQEPLGDLPVSERRRIVIVGAGPSGYTAAIYTARAKLRPLLFCGPLTGGQLMLTSDIENFPGYPEAVSGPQMMDDFRRQAERFGSEICENIVEAVDLSQHPFRLRLRGEKTVVQADAVIIATGATATWLNAPEEEYVKGRGVSTCAVCDGALCMGEDVVVVGGGDTALEDALFLARFASTVTIVHRKGEFRASALMLERAARDPNIIIKRFRQVKRWLHDDSGLTGVELEDPRDPHVTETLKVAGAFVAIGHDAQSKLFNGQLAMDEDGYILHARPASSTMTSVPGVFSCGDVSDRRYRQAATAAGQGCQSALDAERWLDRVPEVGY